MAGFCGTYSHSPGDVFVFKGGVVWPAGALPLTITYSGVSGNTDTYTTDHTWFSGPAWKQPAMDGQLKGRTILSASGKAYFTINDILFINAGALSANNVRAVELSECDNMELSNNTFAPESWGCLYIWTSKPKVFNNYLIHHNDISKCAFGLRIVPSGASSIINNAQIYNNNFHDFHSQLSGSVHGDGIQHYCSPDVESSYDRYITGFKIFNNSFSGDFTQVAGGSGAMTALIYLSGASKGVEIYNNVFTPFTSGAQKPNFFESFISLRDNPNRGGFHKIYNNTFVTQVADGQAAAIIEDDPQLPSPSLDIRNNIFSGFQWAFDVLSASTFFDYNNINCVKSIGKFAGSWVSTFSDWQKLGHDIHGINLEPQFVSSTDFHICANSPCKDRGVILGEPYAFDRDGKKRPQGPTFDMGAYEIVIPISINSLTDFVPVLQLWQTLESESRMYDLCGRLVKPSKISVSAHRRIIVIVPDGRKNASLMQEVNR